VPQDKSLRSKQIGLNAPAFFAIKFLKNFCGAFGFLCYIHALSMALVWTNPANEHGMPYECTD